MFVAAVLSYRIMTPLQDSTPTTCCKIAKDTVPGVVDWQGRERRRVGRTSRIRPRPQVVGSDKTNRLGREAKLNPGVDELLHTARLVVVNVEGTKVNRDCSKRYCDKTSLARKEWMRVMFNVDNEFPKAGSLVILREGCPSRCRGRHSAVRT